MRWLQIAEVAGSLVPALIYVVLFGRAGRHRERAIALLVIWWVLAYAVLEAAILMGLIGWRLPEWVGAVVLAPPMVVSWWRLIAFLRERPGKP